MWSKKWYLKRNISCDVHLLNELLETDVPWDDAIVVSTGKLRKLWDSLSELRSFACERRLERTVLRATLLHVKTCAVYTVFPSGTTSHNKIAQFNWECIGRFRLIVSSRRFGGKIAAPCSLVTVLGSGGVWTLWEERICGLCKEAAGVI